MSDPYALAAHTSFDAIEPQFRAALSETADPRGPEALFDLVAELQLPAGASVVDVGCGRGRQSVELANRFGFHVLGIDPVNRRQPVERSLESSPLEAGTVRFAEGTAEKIPASDASVDFIYCRDSIMFADIDAAAIEFRRVLRRNAVGLVYLVLDGPLMTEDEAKQFAKLMRGRSLRPADIETALERGGLEVTRRVDYGGEWGERSQEDEGIPGQRLLFASRLLRQRERFITQFGQDNFDIMLGDCLWHAYRLMGKLAGYACTFANT